MAKVGRPRIVETPEEFDARVDAYLEQCAASDEPITLTGMVLALGFCDRSTLYDYQGRPEFSHSVKRARAIVENAYEVRLAKGEQSAAGPIFALKNFGWSDKQEVQHSGEVRGGVLAVPLPVDADEWRQAAREHDPTEDG